MNADAEGRAQTAQVAAFDTADGMESSETNGEGQPAGWKARDGRLWFPTTRGVMVIDPRTLQNTESTEVSPRIIIEQVVADGEVIYGDDLRVKNSKPEIQDPKFKLPPGRGRVLRVRYTANSFADPRRVRFRYRLGGQNQDWGDVTDERAAFYTDLKPGDYRFEVKAANAHGIWSESAAMFAFSLAPHFWQTWTFYVV